MGVVERACETQNACPLACSVDILGLRQSEFSGSGAGARRRAWEGREQVQVAIRESMGKRKDAACCRPHGRGPHTGTMATVLEPLPEATHLNLQPTPPHMSPMPPE